MEIKIDLADGQYAIITDPTEFNLLNHRSLNGVAINVLNKVILELETIKTKLKRS